MSGNLNDLVVEGFTNLNGNRYVNVRDQAKSVWLRHALFAGGSQAAISALADDDIVIMAGPRLTGLRASVANLNFVPRPLIEKVGWTFPYFALPDGTVFGPPSVEPGIAVFKFDALRCRASGRLPNWRTNVAAPLADNALASFFVMQTFAPPLLRDAGLSENIGFELAGINAVGKSSLQRIMASVLGPMSDPSVGRYQVSLSTTLAGLEDYIEQHADLPMILDEENRVAPGQAQKARDDLVAGLIWQLSGVESKKRKGERRAGAAHTIFTISSNDPALQAVANRSARYASATADRLKSIEIPEGGVFSPAPDGHAGPGEFADALSQAAETEHGTAIRRFLAQLVTLRALDPAALQQRIRNDIAYFSRLMGVSPSQGSANRTTLAFGIVYAAGRLAREFRALPQSYDSLWAATQCYGLYLQQREAALPEHRLAAFALREDVLDWDRDGKTMTREQCARYVACIRTNRRGERELRIPPSVFNSTFRRPEILLGQADAQGLLLRDRGSRRRKRPITPMSDDIWTYCFVRPEVLC